MADVTISQLTQGTPNNGALLPYSQGGTTLSVALSALLQNVGNVGIGTSTPNGTLAIVNNGGNGIILQSSASSPNISLILIANYNNTGRVALGASSEVTTRPGMSLVTGDAERLIISKDGYVTTPYQPIFRASMTGGNGNQGAFIKVPFNYTPVNVGGHYSLTDKQFNVPIAGNYHFTAGHMNSQNNSGYGTIEIRKNNLRQCFFHNSNSHPMSTSYSIIMQCSPGDYIDMWASNYHFGGAAELGYDYPTLMGYLIG